MKCYAPFSFDRNMGRNIAKNIRKKLSSKHSQKLLDHAKQPTSDAFKTWFKKSDSRNT